MLAIWEMSLFYVDIPGVYHKAAFRERKSSSTTGFPFWSNEEEAVVSAWYKLQMRKVRPECATNGKHTNLEGTDEVMYGKHDYILWSIDVARKTARSCRTLCISHMPTKRCAQSKIPKIKMAADVSNSSLCIVIDEPIGGYVGGDGMHNVVKSETLVWKRVLGCLSDALV